MRMCDLSSDVCSSDLSRSGRRGGGHAVGRTLARQRKPIGRLEVGEAKLRQGQLLGHQGGLRQAAGDTLATASLLMRLFQGFLGGGDVAQKLLGAHRIDRKSTRLNSSHYCATRMPSSA